MWVLGTSQEAARWAARYGTGFCYSLHHASADSDGPSTLCEYRRRFRPSTEFQEAAGIVVAGVACATTSSKARALKKSFDRTSIVGTAVDCTTKLEEIARRFGVCEVMVLDLLGGGREELSERYRMLAARASLTPRLF